MEGQATSGLSQVQTSAPRPLKALSVVLFLLAVFAFVGSAMLWGQGPVWSPPDGVSIALPLADMFVNAPATLVAAVGLWRLRRYGYVAGYFVAGIYLYASAFIIVEALETRPADFWAILIPQLLAVMVGVALLLYLPRARSLFR